MRPATILLLLLAGCAESGPPLVAGDVEVTRPMPGMNMSAGYLVLRNATSEPVEITRVTSPQFASVEMHETRVEDGISRMRKLDRIVVPARGEARFEHGGKHLMLMDPRDLEERVTLTLFAGDTPVLTINYELPPR